MSVSPKPAAPVTFSPAEQETVRLLARGLTNPEIATVRGVALSTVKSQVQDVMKKLHAADRQAVIARKGEVTQKPRVIALDFDGVMNTYTGWQGEEELFQPRPGLYSFLEKLAVRGFHVVIYSTREPAKIKRWLKVHELHHWVRKVTREKPPAICYVDDRAVRFDGDFHAALAAIDTFRAHWES